MLKIGGNKKFKEFLNSYKISKNINFEQKYNMKASEFYRKKLKAELNCDNFSEEKPDLIEGVLFKKNSNKDLSNKN